MMNIYLINYLNITVEQESKPFDFVDFFNRYYQLFIVALTIIAFIILLFLATRISNRVSKRRMERNKNNLKYMPSVYVEMGDAADNLRHFSYKKMQKKANFKLNMLLNDDLGKAIKKYSGIPFWYKFNCFFNHKINRIQKLKKTGRKEVDNYLDTIIYGSASYFFDEKVKNLNYKHSLFNKRIIIVKGNAGTGKTNLICNYTSSLFKRYKHVIYINAKDVEGSFHDYFYGSFYGGSNVSKIKLIAIKVNLLLKFIFNKKLFVIIEGLNENENPNFSKELLEFISKHNSRVYKYVISTREEHFSRIFNNEIKEYFDSKILKYLDYIDLVSPSFNNHDIEYAFRKYANAYDFSGSITDNTKRIIGRNFFMIRLFFETYKGRKEQVDIKSIHALFDAYLHHLSSVIDNMDSLLDKMCELMVKHNKYDYVLMKELRATVDKKTIYDSISENIILNLYIGYQDQDPFSLNEECISFLFDEFRDYLLTRYLIKNTKNPVGHLETIISNNYSCSEGVARYLYMYYREARNIPKIEEIFAIPNVGRVNEIKKDGRPGTMLHFITNYLIDSETMPFDYELRIIDEALHYENAKAFLWHTIEKMPDDDSLLIRLLNYIDSEPNGFFAKELESIKSETTLKDIKQHLSVIGYKNARILDIIDNCIQDCEDNKESKFDSYDGGCFEIVNHDYIVFYKKKQISFKEFLEPFGVIKETYFYKKIKNAYMLLYGCSWSLKKEFRSYYMKEFSSYNDYLVSVNKIPTKMIEKCILYDGHIKYLCSFNGNSMSALFRIIEIENILEKVCIEHYEN